MFENFYCFLYKTAMMPLLFVRTRTRRNGDNFSLSTITPYTKQKNHSYLTVLKMSLLKATSSFCRIQRTMGYIHNRSAYWVERIGNREIVGYGMNGQPTYVDHYSFPFPAIRYLEATPEIRALYEKQKGDWKRLTKEEKKALYRANFCQTFAEFQAPSSGEWMGVVGLGLVACSLGVWLYIFMRVCIEPDLPDSFKPSHIRAQMRRMIDMQANPIRGLSSNWDYEKNDWKEKRWNTPPNPFVRCPDDDETTKQESCL